MADVKRLASTGREGLNVQDGNAPGQHRIVKRPRPVKSCLECRRRKLKCDRLLPCAQCQKSQRSCHYAGEGDAGSLSEGSDVESADRASKRNRASPKGDGSHRDDQSMSQANTALLEEHTARIERLERILLEKPSPATEKSCTSSGSQRPVPSVLTLRGLTVKGASRTRFIGPSNARVLVNLFDEAKEILFSQGSNSDAVHSFWLIQKIQKAIQEEHKKVTAPIGVFMDSTTPIQKRMADVLPSKAICDRLVRAYLDGFDLLYRVLHIPSFMSQYNQYWEGNQQPECFLPQLLSIMCVGYRITGAGKGQFRNDREGIHMPTACALVRAWLDGLRGKQLVEFSSLQTEVLLLMAQRVLNTHYQETWRQLGLLVRMAMTMGLHRDPSEYSHEISPFWAEQRRKVWTTILELDIHFSVQLNLPCCIREGEFTCQPPRNLNDDELHPNMAELPPSKPIEVDTNARVQVLAANTMKTRLRVVDMVSRIDSIHDYQEIIDVANELEQALEDMRYLVPPKQSSDPKEEQRRWMTRVTLDVTCRRPLLALYRPFALGSADAPKQVVTGYLRSCMIILTYLDELDASGPNYPHSWQSHHLILRRDITPASFGVCYYLKNIQQGGTPSPEGAEAAEKQEAITAACRAASKSSVLLSLPRLRATAEKTIEDMIKCVSEIGMDLKELVALTIVFYKYQGGAHEEKNEVQRALQRIVDAGLEFIQLTQETILPVTMMPPQGQQQQEQLPMMDFQTDQMILGNAEQYMLTPDLQNAFFDGFDIWNMDVWNQGVPDQ